MLVKKKEFSLNTVGGGQFIFHSPPGQRFLAGGDAQERNLERNWPSSPRGGGDDCLNSKGCCLNQ